MYMSHAPDTGFKCYNTPNRPLNIKIETAAGQASAEKYLMWLPVIKETPII